MIQHYKVILPTESSKGYAKVLKRDMKAMEKLFIGALALFVVGGLITASAPNFSILLAGRMLQGAAQAWEWSA